MPLSNHIEQTPHGFKGEPARLIPSIADNALERRGISILLAALTAVHEYRKVMLESIGHRVGQRARIEAWTEVVFPDKKMPRQEKRRSTAGRCNRPQHGREDLEGAGRGQGQ